MTTDYYNTDQLAERLRDLAAKVAAFGNGRPLNSPPDRVPRPVIDPLCDLERWADKHGNDPRNRSCMDRIEDQAASNEETFGPMMFFLDGWDRTNHEDRRDAARERVEESPLSVTRNGTKLHVQESWGGPSDGYKVEFDPRTGAVEAVEYYFQDWFDGAKLDIEQRDYPATWRYLEYWAQAAAEGVITDEGDE